MKPEGIELQDERKIYLQEIYLRNTYAGLLEGRPNKEINERIIRSAVEHSSKLQANDSPTYVVEPPRTNITLTEKEKEFRGAGFDDSDLESIPPTLCIAHFISYDGISTGMMSYMNIVWFQEEFGLPIKEEALERIKKIDWNENAADGDW